jgi:hypothetical protein
MTLGGTEIALLLLVLALLLGLIGILSFPQRLLRRIGAPTGPTGEERLLAEERARTLLRQQLGEERFALLLRRGYLEIPSPSLPDRSYRIPYTQGMVDVIEGGVATMRLCIVPTRWVPDGDLVIMHKVLIEGDEARYLRVANRFPTMAARLVRG